MKKVFGLIIIIIMLGSSFFGIASIFYTPKIKIPPPIIEHSLDSNTKTIIISNGATIMEFRFNKNCDECYNLLSFLENFVKENYPQIFLQKIEDNNEKNFTLTIESNIGMENINEFNITKIMTSICNLMYIQPTDCLKWV